MVLCQRVYLRRGRRTFERYRNRLEPKMGVLREGWVKEEKALSASVWKGARHGLCGRGVIQQARVKIARLVMLTMDLFAAVPHGHSLSLPEHTLL